MTDEPDMTGSDDRPMASVRARLAAGRPQFAAAVEREARVEQFCQDVRQRLRNRRKLMGLDQAAVATALEIGQSAVSKLENGEGDIGLKTLFRYARALGLEPQVSFVPAGTARTEHTQTATEDLSAALQQVIQQQLLALNNLQSTAAMISEAKLGNLPPVEIVASE